MIQKQLQMIMMRRGYDSMNEPFASEPVIAVAYGKIACETCGKRFNHEQF